MGRWMDRRSFMKAAGAGVAAAAFAARGARAAEGAGAKPNIVFILADDLGYGDVGCLNPECKIPTPNIDRLAREGMRFTDAHSGSAVCTPTRYGILTGRYCWRSRLKNGVLEGWSPALVDEKRVTVASLLRGCGYRTACVGKWHLGLDWAATDGKRVRMSLENVDYGKPVGGGPVARGFDYFFGIPASLDMPPYVYVENDRVVEAATGTAGASEKPAYYRAGPSAPSFRHGEVLAELSRKAVGVIDRHAAEAGASPLFLYFPLTAPHTPIMPPPEFQGKSGVGAYGDFVCQTDHVVGEIMAALERNGMAENTLLVFTSDNGFAPMADFDALRKQGHDPSRGFRGGKADIFEGGHRIPLVARWPERITPGAASDQTVCLTDLMATAAAINNTALPENAGEDSVSLLPVLAGTATGPVREAVVHHSVDGSFSIRQGQWKLEFCAGSGGWSDPKPEAAKQAGLPGVQLYNLAADPAEKTNLQDKHPDVVARLTALMDKYVSEGRSTPGPPQQNDGPTSFWGPKAALGRK